MSVTTRPHGSQAARQTPKSSRKGKDEHATVEGEDDSIFSKAASLVASSSLLDMTRPRPNDANDTRDDASPSTREPNSSRRAGIARPGFKRVRVIQEVRELLPGEKHRYDLDIDCSWRHKEHQRRGDGAKVVVAWQFALLSYLATVDVGFAASFQKKPDSKDPGATAGKATTVSPYERVACDDNKPYFGDWTAVESGTLTVEWDNSFSMFTSKHMHLLIEVWEESIGDNGNSENGGGGSFNDDAADNLKLASEKALDARVEEKDLKAEKAPKWSVLRSLGKTSFRMVTRSSDATSASNGAPSKAEHGGVLNPPSATHTTIPTSVSSSTHTSFLQERSHCTSGNDGSSVQDDKDDSSIIVNDVDDEVDAVLGGESKLSSSVPTSGIGVIGSGSGFVFGSPSTWEMNLRKYLGEDEVDSESVGRGGPRDETSTKEENYESFSFSSPSEMMARMKAKMSDLVSG